LGAKKPRIQYSFGHMSEKLFGNLPRIGLNLFILAGTQRTDMFLGQSREIFKYGKFLSCEFTKSFLFSVHTIKGLYLTSFVSA